MRHLTQKTVQSDEPFFDGLACLSDDIFVR